MCVCVCVACTQEMRHNTALLTVAELHFMQVNTNVLLENCEGGRKASEEWIRTLNGQQVSTLQSCVKSDEDGRREKTDWRSVKSSDDVKWKYAQNVTGEQPIALEVRVVTTTVHSANWKLHDSSEQDADGLPEFSVAPRMRCKSKAFPDVTVWSGKAILQPNGTIGRTACTGPNTTCDSEKKKKSNLQG
jgi:hypothetical protein